MNISLLQIIIFFIIFEVILIYFYTKLSYKIGLVDIPDERKNHKGNIPLIGGLTIYTCITLYFIIFDTSYYDKIIFVSSFSIFILGLYDDLFNLGVAERIFFQTLISLIIIGFGIRIFDLGNYSILGNTDTLMNLGGFGVILSVLCIIGYANAINFSDGLDGLAGGYLINCFISIIFYSYFFGNFENLNFLYLLVLLLIVFLIANFGFIIPKIFLGDSGSTSLGFLASCYLIYFTLPENRYFHPVLAVWAAPLPIFDFLSVFLYRVINKTSPFHPDRNHLHHLLLKALIPPKIVSLILVTSSFLLSFIGLITFIYFGALSSLFLFFFVLTVFSLIYILFKSNNNIFK